MDRVDPAPAGEERPRAMPAIYRRGVRRDNACVTGGDGGRLEAMTPIHAFVTPEYPLLRTLVPGDHAGVPPGHTGIALALLVRGIPSFLCTHLVPNEELDEVLDSLEGGDVRVAVLGLPSGEAGDDPPEMEAPGHPAAFVSLVCADGRRVSLIRIVGRDPQREPETLARFVIRQIARGVQIPDLAGIA